MILGNPALPLWELETVALDVEPDFPTLEICMSAVLSCSTLQSPLQDQPDH